MSNHNLQNLGKYRIVEKIGRGGFATVYRAEDTTLGREVALKILHPQLLTDPGWVDRFHREARTIARLRHPHIVTIYEIGETEARLYIAMDLITGGSTRAWLATKERFTWPQTLEIVRQVADALEYAHGEGVLHRDLKPANILLDPRAGAILTDFGFAKLVGDSSISASLSGGVMGTPAYIAPEIWDGEPARPQTDVYALGCVVYELLTGERLFEGKTPSVVMRKHLIDGPQFPATWPEGTPPGVETVLRRALARAPEERYASAGTLLAALEKPTLKANAAITSADAKDGNEDEEISPSLEEITLTPNEHGDYATLEEAVANIAPGGTIRLAAGEYQLERALLIEKPLTLVGAGMDSTIITCSEGHGVLKTSDTEPFAAEGLTFRYTGTARANVIEIAGGEINLRTCRITGAVKVEIEEGEVVKDGVGLVLSGDCHGFVVGCHIDRNEMDGIRLSGHAHPTLEGNVCCENRWHGISYQETAGGLAKQNKCTGNTYQGIAVTDEAQPVLEGNLCHENRDCGIAYFGSMGGEARQNECVGNEVSGIAISNQARPIVERNSCRKNNTGILCRAKSDGVIVVRKNECSENKVSGIRVGEQSCPTLEGNTCQDNNAGISYDGEAGGTARENTCSKNGVGGIAVFEEAEPLLERNMCQDNNCGISYAGEAGGIARENTCAKNGLGISVVGEAEPLLERKMCQENMTGIGYLKSSSGTAKGNQCIQNTEVGIAVHEQAQPLLEMNICQGNRIGMAYSQQADGIARENICENNREFGIALNFQAQPVLEGNACHRNGIGIAYYHMAGGSSRKNKCYDNTMYGIYCESSSDVYLFDNTCRGNLLGGIQDRR